MAAAGGGDGGYGGGRIWGGARSGGAVGREIGLGIRQRRAVESEKEAFI